MHPAHMLRCVCSVEAWKREVNFYTHINAFVLDFPNSIKFN